MISLATAVVTILYEAAVSAICGTVMDAITIAAAVVITLCTGVMHILSAVVVSSITKGKATTEVCMY